MLFVLLGVSKLDHNRGGAPLHREAVVHRLDGDHRDLSVGERDEGAAWKFVVFIRDCYFTLADT